MSAETHNGVPLPEDATHVETSTLVFGERTAALMELFISFKATATAGQWRRLIEQMGFEPNPSLTGETGMFSALPPQLESLRPYLVGGIALSPSNPDVAFWTFTWSRSPEAPPPPENVRAESAKVGGFPAVLKRIEALWPTNQQVEAEVSAAYALTPAAWRFRLSNMRTRRLQTDDGRFRVTPARWEIEPPSGPVQEILKATPSTDAFKLTGKGSYLLRWTPRFLNEIDGAIWGGLERFLERR